MKRTTAGGTTGTTSRSAVRGYLRFFSDCIASYFCGTAMMEMHRVFADSEALEIAESVARFLVTRLHRSFESNDANLFQL